MKSSENLRVVIGYGAGEDSVRLRQTVLGAGLECVPDDCVRLPELEGRLAQGAGDLVMVAMGDDRKAALETVRVSSRLCPLPIWAIGPTDDSRFVLETLRCGAREYLSGSEIRADLDAALDKWLSGTKLQDRGTVISIFAPVPGSGGTTVAANLAAALAPKHPDKVALVELQRDGTDLATLLDFVAQHTVDDVCRQWEQLDTTCLRTSFLAHHSGVKMLAQGTERSSGDAYRPEAIRRIAVLARTMHAFTVLALDSRLESDQLEAMQLSDRIGLVVRADVPALRRSRRAVEEAVARGVGADRFRVIVNRYGQSGTLPLSMVEKTLGLPLVQAVPDAPGKLNRAANQGTLVSESAPSSGIARSFRKLAKQFSRNV